MNALGLGRSSLNVVNIRKVPSTVSTSPIHLIEGGQLKVYKKLKTTYGHYLIEEGLQKPQEVNCLCIDKTGYFAYTGSDDGLVKCWYLMTGQLIDSLKCFNPITDLTISPDNVYLAASTLTGELRFWLREKLVKICTLSLGSSSINYIKWWSTPNFLYALACSDKFIFIYSLKDIEEKRDLATYMCLNTPVEVFSLGINEQGYLAAGLNTGKIVFWKLTKGQDKKQLTAKYLFEMQENQKKIYLMEWSPIDPL
jgi:WD40 repeat protein